MPGTVNDEMRRAMLVYVTPTYPTYASASLNDLAYRYYEMKTVQVGLGLPLASLQRTYWNAATSDSINDAERKFYITNGGDPAKSTNDLELAYWTTQ